MKNKNELPALKASSDKRSNTVKESIFKKLFSYVTCLFKYL